MILHVLTFSILLILFNLNQFSYSQEKNKNLLKTDTIKTFKLGEISVGSDKFTQKINEITTTVVPFKIINDLDASSINKLRYVLPSSAIRTNSRGEATMQLRGATERQLAVFFDGMPLNIPWDGRADMSFVPTDILGNININNSTSSVLYGANVLGGAIELNTFERSSDGWGSSFRIQSNQLGEIWTSESIDFRAGAFNNLFNVSYMTSHGLALPSDGESLNYQNKTDTDDNIRTNTAQNRINIFARSEYEIDELSKISLSLNYTKDDKGVQAESFQPVQNVRLWQYPNRDRLFSILNFEKAINSNNDFVLKATVWYDSYNQEINAYKDISFSDDTSKTGNQLDNDITIGARISGSLKLDNTTYLNIAANTLFSEHNEKAVDFTNLTNTNTNYNLDFSQQTSSIGVDLVKDFSSEFIFKIGGAYDIHTTPLTGNFKELENTSINDYAVFVNLNYNLNENIDLSWVTNRRSRFPAMREALSGALNRFIANPSLKPESGIINELGISYKEDNFKTKLTGFYNLYDNLIVQIRLNKTQDLDRRRQRVNLQKANVSGLEWTNEYKYKDLGLRFNLTYINTVVNFSSDTSNFDKIRIDTLDNRPSLLSGLVLNYRVTDDFTSQLEMDYLGKSYQVDSDGYYQTIKGNALVNLRLNYNFQIGDSQLFDVFLRVNNILDTFRESQLGIIDAGRNINLGLTYKI